MEKCIVNPRHIEVQVLADSHGHAIHLFERDCSIQRRNQKLIEIAPSPQLTPEQRQYIGGLAVKAARAVGYENAGTVEFLLTGNEVYFMEMNTRVQVEHTITEAITGVDIVREQLRIAAGEPLSYRQEDISYRGYALQFRINAEDPKNDFLPSFGRITHYYAPGGPGVRVDTAIYTGYEIPPYYDSMCLKLVVWALTWDEVIARGKRALDDMRLHGITTTANYYQQILDHPDFRAGVFDTSFVPSHPELLSPELNKLREDIGSLASCEEDVLTYAMFPDLGREFLQQRKDGTLKPEELLPAEHKGRDRMGTSVATEFRIDVHGETYEVAVTGVGASGPGKRKLYLSLDGMPQEVVFESLNEYEAAAGGSGRKQATDPGHVTTTMPGNVVDVLVKEGDTVAAGQAVMITEAMKMETEIHTSVDGTVQAVYVTKGDRVTPGEVLIEIA